MRKEGATKHDVFVCVRVHARAPFLRWRIKCAPLRACVRMMRARACSCVCVHAGPDAAGARACVRTMRRARARACVPRA